MRDLVNRLGIFYESGVLQRPIDDGEIWKVFVAQPAPMAMTVCMCCGLKQSSTISIVMTLILCLSSFNNT